MQTIKKITLLLIMSAVYVSVSARLLDIAPGQLAGKLAEMQQDEELVLVGKCDVRDLMQIQNLPSTVKTLDLSGVTICEYTGTEPIWEGFSHFPAGQLPCYIFFKSGLSKIILPETLLSIGDGAFAGADITALQIPDKVSDIGSHAFYDCQKLQSVSLPASLVDLGDWAFARCSSLESVDLSKTHITKLADRTFVNCTSLENVTLSPVTTELGQEVFSGTAIRNLDLHNVLTADNYALVGMADLESVDLNSQARYGEGMLMSNRNLTEINGMPVDVPGLFAANCTNLKDYYLTDVRTLGDYSLASNKASTLVLGSSLSSVSRGAVKDASNLTQIDARSLGDRVPSVDEDSFMGVEPRNVVLKVAPGTKETWQAAPVWNQFAVDDSDIPTDVDSELDSMFEISAWSKQGVVNVVSNNILETVEIYNTEGQLLQNASPKMSQWSSMPIVNEKIVIIKVDTPARSRTFKIFMQ